MFPDGSTTGSRIPLHPRPGEHGRGWEYGRCWRRKTSSHTSSKIFGIIQVYMTAVSEPSLPWPGCSAGAGEAGSPAAALCRTLLGSHVRPPAGSCGLGRESLFDSLFCQHPLFPTESGSRYESYSGSFRGTGRHLAWWCKQTTGECARDLQPTGFIRACVPLI